MGSLFLYCIHIRLCYTTAIMDENRRGYSRLPFSESVAYAHPEVTVNGSVGGNISLSGISLKVQEFIPMGACLELQIRLGTSSKVIWVKGQVVRMREILADGCYEIGLKFIKDEAALRAIGAYISAVRSEAINQFRK